MGFYLITFCYILAGLVGILGVYFCYDKGSAANKLHITLVVTAVFCCWLMWVIVYLAQWHPLVVPILKAEGE